MVDIAEYKVSERGQMALPAAARRRWDLMAGGAVEILDLGGALLVVPVVDPGGVRSALGRAIDEAGGYAALAQRVANEDPDLA